MTEKNVVNFRLTVKQNIFIIMGINSALLKLTLISIYKLFIFKYACYIRNNLV